jgi:uncharacterized protein
MYYLDSSLIVSFLTNEAPRDRLLAWIGAREAGSLFISPWVSTEISSALSIKQRVGNLAPDTREAAKQGYLVFVQQSVNVLSITDAHFVTAATFADRAEIGLRSGDALHLAVSHAHSLTLATLDKHLAEAGPKLGAATLLL